MATVGRTVATAVNAHGPSTSHGLSSAGGAGARLQEGSKTTVIYGLIRDQKYADAIRLLTIESQNHPRSRAALSLLAYCYYHMQDFPSAASTYEKLVKFFPDVEEYKMYYAQSLYKAGMYPEGTRAALQVQDDQFHYRTLMLQAAIKYEQDDLVACKSLADQCQPEEPETIVSYGCISYKEGNFEEARQRFTDAMNLMGYQPDLAYNIALCHYKMKQYSPALKFIAEIIERGVREHPELSVGSNSEGIEVRSVGNSAVLKETALIEAFNLKAAIEYQVKNLDAAKEALSDMPPRSEQELDPVTLHNQALIYMDEHPTDGFSKLNFLVSQPPFPPETFGNLLLLYCKYQYYALAADIMAEYAHLHDTYLSQELYEYLEAMILKESSPEEAYRKFDLLASKHIENLRRLTKQIQDARISRDQAAIKAALKEYDEALERYIPVLMAQAKIYWDIENYAMVERIFTQSIEFCGEHDVWKLNVAHIFFMLETKYPDAIKYYEPFVKKHSDNLLSVAAIVLANLCVSYIMTSKNEEAEELMKLIEREEDRLQYQNPEKQSYHLCIVNLVIGTLYCAKGNFEFGISRIIKSLEPYHKKLHADTWYYAKRCFLALAETLAKHMLVFKDAFFEEIMAFLTACEQHGKNVAVELTNPDANAAAAAGAGAGAAAVVVEKSTVADEARVLKRLFLRLFREL
eukprot:TRINITY_DN8024_c0_g3_i2.p1 TRINITY_DN8024_c0_g3~~TRINITY_DN8024_c0_g3_i2.p1  ORF type:complete len:689 (+),score=158.90 TRINITY_DN8024_c0_g3_i2:116-2182(+)